MVFRKQFTFPILKTIFLLCYMIWLCEIFGTFMLAVHCYFFFGGDINGDVTHYNVDHFMFCWSSIINVSLTTPQGIKIVKWQHRLEIKCPIYSVYLMRWGWIVPKYLKSNQRKSAGGLEFEWVEWYYFLTLC